MARQISKAARVYAKTFLDYASSHKVEGGLEALREEFTAVLEVFAKTKGLERALNLAALPEEKRVQILRPLAAKASEPLKRLLRLLELKGRLSLLPAIAQEFLRMEEAGRKVRRTKVVSATPLDAGQLESLAKGLAARNPGHTYLLHNEVDASLIAGFRIEEDGLVTDTSLRHKLDSARRSLAAA
jgi:F-type H+-transporting ATPase subunit delta